MTKALLIADHLDGELNSSTARMAACAAELHADALDLLVLTHETGGVGEAAAGIEGVSRVLVAENDANREPLAAILAPQIVAAVHGGDYTHLLCPNTTFGKDLLPRAAALLGVGQVTDIMAVHGPYRFDRPIYAGNAVTTVEAPSDQLLVGTVRCASYPEAGQRSEAAPVESITLDAELPTHTRFVGRDSGGGDDRPDLQTAARVVSGGRGVGSGDNFKIIYSLADKLGAAAGASRAAVDAGFVPNDMQVGQTGKIIAPELYIAVGISGAIQHLAGIKDAGTIVAINSDAEAPIFEIADIRLVGDLFEILPALEAQL